MKQTIVALTMLCKGESADIELTHDAFSINIGFKEPNEPAKYLEIPAEFCDSLIEMLQKRKELMA
jgi:hypothetical protein